MFEYLYKDDVLIATHTDITDEGQTVVVKQFSTTAVNYSDKTHHVTNKIPVSIDDTIQYSGLIPGQTYEAFGEIHLVRNGTDMGVYVDQYGNEAVASVTFSASDSGNGDVIVPFDFGEGNLDKDDKLVVFETIYIVNGDQKEYIGEHKDINDADQTITVTDSEVGGVEIQTTATADGEKSFVAGTDATIVDTVIINGVRKIAGEECVLEGELHIKNNGIDGGTIGSVVRREFTVPLRTESVVELEMIFSGIDLKQYPVGTEFVVFEKLYRVNDGEEILLAEHADIEDTDQTVSVVAVKPSIKTTATGENGLSKVVKTSENVKIVDTVTYTNLVPGKEYTLKGTLHLVNEGKDEEILKTEYATFIPTSANGTIKVTFTIDTSTLKGRSLVVFEDLFEGSVIVASHSDIKDKDQTVVVENDVKPVPTSTPTPTPSGETITSVSTPSGLPSYLQNTGTGYGVFVAAGFLVVAVIGLIVINKPKK